VLCAVDKRAADDALALVSRPPVTKIRVAAYGE
jgi:hypothetical protein